MEEKEYDKILDEVSKYITNLKQQLQAYKDKEDKLREFINSREFSYFFEGLNEHIECMKNLHKILNEGDK